MVASDPSRPVRTFTLPRAAADGCCRSFAVALDRRDRDPRARILEAVRIAGRASSIACARWCRPRTASRCARRGRATAAAPATAGTLPAATTRVVQTSGARIGKFVARVRQHRRGDRGQAEPRHRRGRRRRLPPPAAHHALPAHERGDADRSAPHRSALSDLAAHAPEDHPGVGFPRADVLAGDAQLSTRAAWRPTSASPA